MTEVKSLNQRIAEAFGYRVEWRDNTHFVLIRPDGTEYGGAGASRSEVLAAHYADQSEADTWQLAPDWEHSLDAVADVLPEDYDLLIMAGVQTVPQIKGYFAKIRPYPFVYRVGDSDFYGTGLTRAEAAANALLEYATWKDEGGGE